MELIGIKEISRHLGLSETTTLDMIRLQLMPAEVNKQAVWISSTELIEEWQRRESGTDVKTPTALGQSEDVKLARAASSKKLTAKQARAAKRKEDGEDEDIA